MRATEKVMRNLRAAAQHLRENGGYIALTDGGTDFAPVDRIPDNAGWSYLNLEQVEMRIKQRRIIYSNT